jgi:hypothetical protein
MLERNNLRVVRVLSHELIPDGLMTGIVLTGQLLRGNLPSAAHLPPENGPGIAEASDEQGPVVHDADEAAGPHRGEVRLGLPQAGHEREEGFLRGQERLPDGALGHAARAGGRLCAKKIKPNTSTCITPSVFFFCPRGHRRRGRRMKATRRVWVRVTSEAGEEVVAGEARGVGAGVAVEDADGGAEGRGGVEAALVLEHLVGLGDGDGDVARVAAREVAPPEEAVAALRAGGGGRRGGPDAAALREEPDDRA